MAASRTISVLILMRRFTRRSGIIRSQQRKVVVSEGANQFLVKIVLGRCHDAAESALISAAAAVDVRFKPGVKVLVRPPLRHQFFIVKLDLGNQQPSVAHGVAVYLFAGFFGLRRRAAISACLAVVWPLLIVCRASEVWDRSLCFADLPFPTGKQLAKARPQGLNIAPESLKVRVKCTRLLPHLLTYLLNGRSTK